MPREIRVIPKFACFSLIALMCPPACRAMAEDFSQEIEHLSKGHPRAERIAAIEKLHGEHETKGAEKAIPALSACAKDDDPFIRSQSLLTLGLIAVDRKLPCPDPLVEALLDPDESVRHMATNLVGASDGYSPASLATAYRALEHDDYIVRSAALEVIKFAGQHDKKALPAVKRALNDKNRQVRHNARVALWKLTGDREMKVRNLVEDFIEPVPAKASAAISNEEICEIKVSKGGAPMVLHDMSREYPRDVASLLIKLTKDASPSMRSGAASMLGVCFGSQVKLSLLNSTGGVQFPDGDQFDETEADKTKRRLTADMGIENVLQGLRDDPDESVRKSAIAALDQLNEKKK